ncbi:MAG TPA: AAA family ATPase, partial [Phycisphaerae bacterium]|nr:AAA family ATPase [Phycisphaerae bacterium]
TEAVPRRPYSVVLFDEIEKAHRDVFNVLLQMLDDGRLTDGHGRTIDFKNTIIVMTSNLGSDHLQRLADQGAGDVEVEMAVKEVLKGAFRPEFLNRIDEVLVFHRLAESHMERIAEIQLGHLRRRLADHKLGLEVSPAALARLAKDGYDPVYGARPLKRLIQQYIENPLSKRILAGDFAEGDTIAVDVGGLMFEFNKATGARAAAP